MNINSQDNVNQTDYTGPLITLVTNKMCSINNFDKQLIEYCENIGFDNDVILSIFLAQKKKHIEEILSHRKKNYYNILLNICKFKKLSAEKKFRMDYAMFTDEQLATLLSKQFIE